MCYNEGNSRVKRERAGERKERMTKIMPGLRWTVAVATVIVALLLGWQCVGLYRAGNSPENLDENGVRLTPVFSVEKVAARLEPLRPALAAYVLLVAAALVLQAGEKPARETGRMTPENRLRLVRARTGDLPEAAAAEERFRRRLRVETGAVVVACAAVSLGYLLDGSHFVSWELEAVMAQLLVHVAPPVVLAFAALIAASLACGRSVERELAALRRAPGTSVQATPLKKAVPWVRSGLRLMLYAVAVAFIVLGVMNGGLRDVLVKAINICTECIGLG